MEEHENLNNQDEVNEEKIHENIEETKEENSSEEVKKEPVKEEIKQEEKTEYKKVKHVEKNNPKKVKAIIISLIIVLAVMIFSIIFALLNMSNDKILKGITILGIDVSNLTIEEATTKVNNAIDERFKEENSSLILKREDNETNVTANTYNAKFDTDSAINEAYNIGRKGNIITNNYEILITELLKKEIKPTLYLDEDLLSNTIKDINSKLKDAVVENSYYIEKQKLILVKGKAGYTIKTE